MANPEHLALLHQGVETWNRWRTKNPAFVPNLTLADLKNANLSLADLRAAKLTEANLAHANLANANLAAAVLNGVSLCLANLSGTDLSGADLRDADLRGANVQGTNLAQAILGSTMLVALNLGEARGLETARHYGPSSVGLDTFFQGKGTIPEIFLRGCGLPDIFLEYASSLAGKPFEFYSCFISYSSKDQAFAERLHADLQAQGVRCWFAPEDLMIGDKFRTEIDRAIRVHDKLLLLLSSDAVASDWVEKEVETALERERRDRRAVLFPVRLDDTVLGVELGWAADIRRSRQIGDFTQWKHHDAYQKAFDRLLRDLKASRAPAAPKRG